MIRERLVADLPTELAQIETKGRMLEGYASVFDHPIDSGTRGHPQTTYVRPGAFTRTLKNNRDQIQVLFNHGHDPRYGELPIGTIKQLEEDRRGLRASVELHDGPDNENIRAALASGALRAMSIQFETMQEDFSEDGTERNIREVKLWEFGPVTFPANTAAVASLHSLAALAYDLSRHQMMPMPTTKAGMARHLREQHDMSEEDIADMSMAEKQAMHRRMHRQGADHEHEGMSADAPLEAHWDGAAALRSASTAAEFRKIAFERRNDSDPDTAAHWALPHHPNPKGAPGNADSAGVAAALAALHGGRGGAPDLVMSVASVEAHLQAHQSESSSVETRESTLDEARLTWLLRAGRSLDRSAAEMAREMARIRQL